MALATAAALAGAAAIGKYADAKWRITGDIRDIKRVGTAVANHNSQLQKNGTASVWPFFEAQVERLPAEEVCIWSRSGVYTWRDTRVQAVRYAKWFLSRGVKPGQLVALYMLNSPEFVFATLGLWAIGVVPAWLNANMGGEGLVHCVRLSGANLMFVDNDEVVKGRMEEMRSTLKAEGVEIELCDEQFDVALTQASDQMPEPLSPELRKDVKPSDAMCLIYTSGSTGMPKACPFRLANVWAITDWRNWQVGTRPGPGGDRWYICMPLYHGTGGTAMVNCLTTGVSLAIGRKFRASKFWEDVRESRSTLIIYVGETARYLLAAPPDSRDRDHKVWAMFGNGMRPDVWTRFRERFGIQRIVEFFNSTEGILGMTNPCDGDFQANCIGVHGPLLRRFFHNTYVPVQTDELGTILRDAKTGLALRVPYEEGGEILVAAPDEETFVGYWKNPEATKKKYVRDILRKGDLFIRTGDSLRRDEYGRWSFKDRLGDTYRWKSENVSTTHVTNALGNYPGLVEVCVYGVEIPGHDGKAGCAAIFVEEAKKRDFDYAHFLSWAHKQLPKFAVPVFVRELGQLTPMHNNKQNKVPLQKEGIDLEKVEEGSNGKDRLLWWPGALGKKGSKESYVEFSKQDSEELQRQAARL